MLVTLYSDLKYTDATHPLTYSCTVQLTVSKTWNISFLNHKTAFDRLAVNWMKMKDKSLLQRKAVH